MDKTFKRFITLPVVEFTFFSILGLFFWFSQKEQNILPLIIFIYIAVFVPGGMLLYAFLPSQKKNIGRRFTYIMAGLLLFLEIGILGRQNLQLEGLFFTLLSGFFSAALLHYCIAKIIGPIILNRAWCGWGCWTMMILDLLPYKESSGRLKGKWGFLRYLHFIASLILVVWFWNTFRYSIPKENWGMIGLYWFLIGNALYYALGIILAIILKDNRAFCKYACPITVFLKLSSIFSLLKIKTDKDSCQGCQQCMKACPMDIRIPEYTKLGTRVLSSECTLCLKCINACPNKALKVSVGFDIGGKDFLNEK